MSTFSGHAIGYFVAATSNAAFLVAVSLALLVVSVALIYRVSIKTALRTSPLAALLIAATIFAGLMAAGYAVFDELAVYGLLAMCLLLGYRFAPVADSDYLCRLHRALFIAFMAYLVGETLRGMISLGDVRVIRFTVLFAITGLIAYAIRPTSANWSRLIVASTTVYLGAYLIIGIVAESLGVWRFDLQGSLWVGTTAAFVPAVVMTPSLIRVSISSEAVDRKLFWTAATLFGLDAFYYQSRLGWMTLMIIFSCLLVARRFLPAAIVGIAYLLMVGFFPWSDPRPLTPPEFARFVAGVIAKTPESQPADNFIRFSGAVFGTFVPERAKMEIVATRGGEVRVLSADEVTETQVTDLKRQGFIVITHDNTSIATDVDRKLAIIAALQTVTGHGLGRLFFGSGYYTHRYKMLPAIHDVGNRHHFVFPPSYDTIVRTATMNGMLVDTGFVGVGLFVGMFALVGLTALWRWKNGSSLALVASCLGALAILGIGQFSGSNFDMILVYLALMPGGPLLLPLQDT